MQRVWVRNSGMRNRDITDYYERPWLASTTVAFGAMDHAFTYVIWRTSLVADVARSG